MRIRYERLLKNGKRHVLVELGEGEELAQPIKEDRFYKLQYPLDDQVFAGHILKDPTPVVWDTFEQRWLE
jgi:hypothetical protein